MIRRSGSQNRKRVETVRDHATTQDDRHTTRRNRLLVVMVVWGFAEATLLFIAPEVLVTVVAVRERMRTTLKAIAALMAGAVPGTAVMYQWAQHHADDALQAVSAQPGVTQQAILDVRASLISDWPIALFEGALSGVPQKLFATEAGGLDISFASFLAVAAPARAITPIILALIAGGLAGLLANAASRNTLTIIVVCAWVVFYAIQFNLVRV